MIPIAAVDLDERTEKLVLEVLRSGRLAQGPMVERFESLFADRCGTRHAVAVANGTVALVAPLQALGIGPGDEVVTSPFTFVATLNAILETGATARFADIDPATFTVRPDAVAAALTDRTKVILPVHLFGQPADLGALTALAADHGCALVEDAAQAHGATFAGRPAGSFGTGCFSFYATKNIAMGEGGAVTTSDDDLADRLRLLRNQGMRARYEYEIVGHNYRLSELQAAVGIPQLEHLDALIGARQAHAQTLSDGLADLEGVVLPTCAPDRTHVWHQYTVRLTSDARRTRDDLAAALGEKGIATGIYYPRVAFDYACYRDHPGVAITPVPEAERAAAEVLALPVHPQLSASDLDHIISAMRELLG